MSVGSPGPATLPAVGYYLQRESWVELALTAVPPGELGPCVWMRNFFLTNYVNDHVQLYCIIGIVIQLWSLINYQLLWQLVGYGWTLGVYVTPSVPAGDRESLYWHAYFHVKADEM